MSTVPRAKARGYREATKVMAHEAEMTSINTKQVRYVVENLQQDIVKLRKEIRALQTAVVRSTTFIASLLDDPDAQQHASAVLRDFRYSKLPPKKS